MERIHDRAYAIDPASVSSLISFGSRILVLGDVIIDHYVLGSVKRVSPEAPIPVLFAEQRRSVLGGAAIVARNIASLGAWFRGGLHAELGRAGLTLPGRIMAP